MGNKTMFSERELLILSFAMSKLIERREGAFFAHVEADALLDKVHNVLRTQRNIATTKRNLTVGE
jgi:hypothetical protein